MTFQNIAVDWKINPRIPVISIEQLNSLLASFADQEPGFIEFESATSGVLQLGIGGQFACAQLTTHGDEPRYLSPKARTIRAKDDIEFLCGGTPTPIVPEFCLSFEEAIKIAEHFFNTGKHDPDFKWIEV